MVKNYSSVLQLFKLFDLIYLCLKPDVEFNWRLLASFIVCKWLTQHFSQENSIWPISVTARLLRSQVRIPLGAWMFVSCVYIFCPVSVEAFATSWSLVPGSPTKCLIKYSEIKKASENFYRRSIPKKIDSLIKQVHTDSLSSANVSSSPASVIAWPHALDGRSL
jgi:hypothetical protein